MAARLDSLGDQYVDPGAYRRFRIAAPTYLVQHQDARILEAADQLGLHVPEQRHGRHLQLQAGGDLFGKQVAGRGRRDQVDGERTFTQGAIGLDFPADQLDRLAHHAQASEAAGIAHRCCKLVARHTAHASADDRHPAAQQVDQWGMQRGMGHGELLRPQGRTATGKY
ncbi:hypothetical protein D3C80_977130 [compost metagenome]